MRIALDSINPAAIPEDWPFVIGYFNGPVSAWPASAIAERRARGNTVILVDVIGDAWEHASIIDWEKFDVQNPETLAAWVRNRNQYRGDATVYCNRSSLPAVTRALAKEYWNLWLADLTPNGEPPMTPPALGLPNTVKLVAVQYVFGPQSGGDYDMSIVYDDKWHPSHPTGAAPRETVQLPGTPAAAAADPTASPQPDTSEASAPSSPEPPTPAADAPSPAPADASAPASEPSPGPAEPDAAAAAAESDVSRETTPSGAKQLPHSWMQRVLSDAEEVARLFRGAGASSAAAVLEQALMHANEIGNLLMKAGL